MGCYGKCCFVHLPAIDGVKRIQAIVLTSCDNVVALLDFIIIALHINTHRKIVLST